MYFLLIRPQKKREKEINAMRKGVQVGDEIITIGGICGKIVKTKEESLVIQVGADKVKFEIMRWAVSRVVEESKRPAKARNDEADDVEEAEEEKPAKKPRRLKKAAAAEETAKAEEKAEAAEAEAEETARAEAEAEAEDVKAEAEETAETTEAADEAEEKENK